jgi:hypothetical protein
MCNTSHTAAEAVELVLGQARGLRCYLTGSAASAAAKARDGIFGFESAYSDVDLFVGSENEWIRSIQFLIDHGYTFGDRMEMLWTRVLHYGTLNWHTNSMRLANPEGIEVNLVYKTIGRHPTSSLSQVLETFDFGLLAMGCETEDGTYRDARSYQFPGMDPNGPLPLLPWRREAFVLGHFREHQGLRTFGRAARYFDKYGYPGELIVPDLITGYHNAATYFLDRTEQEKILLGQMYQQVAILLEDENWAKLAEASEQLPKMDALDEIYEILIEP